MTQPEPNNIVLVDSQDQMIGTTTKTHAHQAGLIHRAFSVFLLDAQQNVLLQQRHPDKYHCGGLWTNTCCSHPRPDETPCQAGERRLQEELGFSTTLQPVGEFCYRAPFSNGLIEHEYDHVLLGHYHNEPLDQFNPTEIAALRWLSIPALENALEHDADSYTPWLKPALEKVARYINHR